MDPMHPTEESASEKKFDKFLENTSPTTAESTVATTPDELDSFLGNLMKDKSFERTLKLGSHHIECILHSPSVVSIDQALKDFQREKVLLNGVPFVPDHLSPALFVTALKLLIDRYLILSSVSLSSSQTVNNIILQRACRTCSGADSFFKIEKIFHSHGVCLVQRSSSSEPPIIVDIFISDGCLCARIETKNLYALYKEENLAAISDQESLSTMAAWMVLDTTIIDEYNFKTTESTRKMCVNIGKNTYSNKNHSSFSWLHWDRIRLPLLSKW